MRILFVMEQRGNAGSTHAVANYVRVAQEQGHTIAVHGTPRPDLAGLRFATDVESFDRVLFLFESQLYRLNRLREVALLGVPRRHRLVFDADGMYNPAITLDGYDRNHLDEARRAVWLRHYTALADRILQPILHAPADPRVTALPFYGYNPSLRLAPGTAPPQRFDVLLVGHNWWRWRDVAGRLLPAFERARPRLGEIGFVGLWWDAVPEWARGQDWEAAFQVDPERLRRSGIRVEPAVNFSQVIATMSTGRVNILTQRPLLSHFRHLTLKYFEVFCAETIPLLLLDPDHAEQVYGPAGRELTLGVRAEEKILDALDRPARYREIVEEVRRHLLTRHSYQVRLRELLEVLAE